MAPRGRHLRGPTGPEEAEALELGGRVAIFRAYQSLLFDDPADFA